MEKNTERKLIQKLATTSMYLSETATWQTSRPTENGLSSQHRALSPVDPVTNC